jgi:hypothetical protein
MSDAYSASAPKGSFTATLLAAVGGFAIFGLILLVAYLPKKVESVGDGVKTPEQRKAALAELHGKEQTAASTYAWVDKEKGVVRLPIDRAVELVIQEHAKK